MNNALKTVMDHFDRDGVTYRKLNDDPVLRLTFAMNYGIFESLLITPTATSSSDIRHLLPGHGARGKRPQVAELLRRANRTHASPRHQAKIC